jgi:hypothetical protein
MALKQSFGRRVRLVIAANVVVLSILAVVLVVLVNVFTAELTQDEDVRFDFTRERTHSLDAGTKSYVRHIEHDVEVYVVWGEDEILRRAARADVSSPQHDSGIMERIYLPFVSSMAARIGGCVSEAARLNGRLKLRMADTRRSVEEPREWAKRLGISGTELVNRLVVYDVETKRRRSLTFYELFQCDLGGPRPNQTRAYPKSWGDVVEEGFLYSLRGVATRAAKKIYVVEGHKELDSTPLAAVLQSDGFEVAKLQIESAGRIPEDAGALVITSPEAEWPRASRDIVQRWVAEGGRLFLTQGARCREPFATLTETFGATLLQVQLGHPTAYMQNLGRYALFGWDFARPAANQGAHAIVRPLAEAKQPLFLGFTRAYELTADYDQGAVERTVVLRSGDGADAVPYADDDGQIRQHHERGTRNGDFPIMLAAERRAAAGVKPGRIVALATDDALDMSALAASANLGNGDLVRSVVHWLTDSQDFVATKARSLRGVVAPMDPGRYATFTWITVGVAPALVLVCGLLVFAIRRRG